MNLKTVYSLFLPHMISISRVGKTGRVKRRPAKSLAWRRQKEKKREETLISDCPPVDSGSFCEAVGGEELVGMGWSLFGWQVDEAAGRSMVKKIKWEKRKCGAKLLVQLTESPIKPQNDPLSTSPLSERAMLMHLLLICKCMCTVKACSSVQSEMKKLNSFSSNLLFSSHLLSSSLLSSSKHQLTQQTKRKGQMEEKRRRKLEMMRLLISSTLNSLEPEP